MGRCARAAALGAAALLCLPIGAAAQDSPFDVISMPVILVGTRAAQISSFDRSGGNEDGDRRWAYLDFDRGAREFTVFRDVGPGALLRLWMTGWRNPGRLDFFVDTGDEPAEPTFSTGVLEIFSGRHDRFPERYVGGEQESSGGYYSYSPISYQRGLVVRTQSVSRYIQWTYHRYASTKTAAANAERRTRYRDALADPVTVRIPPVEVAAFDSVEVFSTAATAGRRAVAPGGGVITKIQLSLTSPAESSVADREMLRLEIAADFDTSQVSVPLVQYFGGVPNREPVDSLVVASELDGQLWTLTSTLPVPFADHCSIRLVNNGSVPVQVCSVTTVAAAPAIGDLIDDGVVGYLHAQYNSATTRPGRDMLLANLSGHGQLAGLVLSTAGSNVEDRKILEGDERVFVDGQLTPSLHGTGTEDFFNGGWYYKYGTFSQPWHGNPSHTTDRAADRTTQFRFLVSDPIPFSRELIFAMEHGPRNDEPGAFSATAFWYGSRSPSGEVATISEVFADTDLVEAPLTARRLGTQEREAQTYRGGSIPTGTEVVVQICAPEETGLLILRRLVDMATANQLVGVTVNGSVRHDWYTPGFTEESAIVQTEYLIPGTALHDGQATVRLRSGSPWNSYGFSAIAVLESMED